MVIFQHTHIVEIHLDALVFRREVLTLHIQDLRTQFLGHIHLAVFVEGHQLVLAEDGQLDVQLLSDILFLLRQNLMYIVVLSYRLAILQ